MLLVEPCVDARNAARLSAFRFACLANAFELAGVDHRHFIGVLIDTLYDNIVTE